MIAFERYILDNGLKVLVHEDPSTPMAVVNLLYNVGARDEEEDKTGFAHLFEHLMFEGSENAPSFDEPIQRAGGDNNAFTNNDITNYYVTLPAVNIETALWLEADRMKSLTIDFDSLTTQQKVVIEEFKENYLNQPYGDVWHLLRELTYKVHPYRWPTIGKSTEHIEKAKLKDVQHFFDKFYTPNNAILVLAGNVKSKDILKKVEHWFGDIEPGEPISKKIPKEPVQIEPRKMEVYRDIPASSIYKAWPMVSRVDPLYYKYDLMTDLLSSGKSSILYRRLVKETQLFTTIDAYITGSLDEGLLIVNGRLAPDVAMEEAEEELNKTLNAFAHTPIDTHELQKIKNKIESSHEFNEVSLMNRAFNLAYYELIGNAKLVNQEIDQYLNISAQDVQNIAASAFEEDKCSTLYYYAINPEQHD